MTNAVYFCIYSYETYDLLITASTDFAYYHEVEATFKDMKFVSLPRNFKYPVFRIANASEIKNLRKIIALEKNDTVFCVSAATSASLKKIPFYIVAEEVTIREGMVYYYERENLEDGERIADWVSRESEKEAKKEENEKGHL